MSAAYAATTFYTKQGNTSPTYQVALKQGDGSVLDLTSATVVFSMTRKGSSTPKVNLAACTIDNPSLGLVTYQWLSADVDTPGTYDAEFRVTLPGPRIQRVPGYGFNTVVIGAIL